MVLSSNGNRASSWLIDDICSESERRNTAARTSVWSTTTKSSTVLAFLVASLVWALLFWVTQKRGRRSFNTERSRERDKRKKSMYSEFADRSWTACPYQAAELEESRRTSAVVIERGCVTMGTGASLLPQVSVVVDGVRALVTARSGTLSAPLRRCRPHGLDKVHLVAEIQEPPVVRRKNKCTDAQRSV